MTEQRYREVEVDNKPLTKEELEDGWHFCPEWDYMLIHPSFDAADACLCHPK